MKNLHLPDEIHAKIKKSAHKNKRTLIAEIDYKFSNTSPLQ